MMYLRRIYYIFYCYKNIWGNDFCDAVVGEIIIGIKKIYMKILSVIRRVNVENDLLKIERMQNLKSVIFKNFENPIGQIDWI